MKDVVKDVKTAKLVDDGTGNMVKKQVTVGTVTCPIYENVDELIANVEPATILGLFNKANVIRLQGNERAKHQDKAAGKTKRRGIAYDNCITTEELASYAGQWTALQTFLDSDEMNARVDAHIAASE